MNFITCRKCGAKLVTQDLRVQELSEYLIELELEASKLRKKKNKNPNNNQNINECLKPLTDEIRSVQRQLKVAKMITHLETCKSRDNCIVEELKIFVDRDQFLLAVERAKERQKQYESQLESEIKKAYGFEQDAKEKRKNRNASGALDLTASIAIKNADRR